MLILEKSENTNSGDYLINILTNGEPYRYNSAEW